MEIHGLTHCLLTLLAHLPTNTLAHNALPSPGLVPSSLVRSHTPWHRVCGPHPCAQSTTTGYGDFTPRSVAEQVFANLYMILGMVLFGLLVGTIANALTRASASAAQLYRFRKKISAVSGWLEEHHIPEATRKQVQTYFSEVWVNRNEASLDSEIFSDLPSFLRARVAQYITTDLVIQVRAVGVHLCMCVLACDAGVLYDAGRGVGASTVGGPGHPRGLTLQLCRLGVSGTLAKWSCASCLGTCHTTAHRQHTVVH